MLTLYFDAVLDDKGNCDVLLLRLSMGIGMERYHMGTRVFQRAPLSCKTTIWREISISISDT